MLLLHKTVRKMTRISLKMRAGAIWHEPFSTILPHRWTVAKSEAYRPPLAVISAEAMVCN